jgi:hypothetical protein
MGEQHEGIYALAEATADDEICYCETLRRRTGLGTRSSSARMLHEIGSKGQSISDIIKAFCTS